MPPLSAGTSPAAQQMPPQRAPTPLALEEVTKPLGQEPISIKEVMADLQRVVLQPQKRDAGFRSSLTRLSVELESVLQEWNAYIGGCFTRKDALDAVAGKEAPKKNMHSTAQAASMLLRLVRSLPAGLFRQLLEPLVQELLEAVYRDWPGGLVSLQELHEDEVLPESLVRRVTFFSLISGYKAHSEQAELRATAAEKSEREHREKAVRLEVQFTETDAELRSTQESLAETLLKLADSEEKKATAVEAYEVLKRRTRIALSDYADMELREKTGAADVRRLETESRTQANKIRDLQLENKQLQFKNTELTDSNREMRRLLDEKDQKLAELPMLRKRLEHLDGEEAIHGVEFARRISDEVFRMPVEILLKQSHGVQAKGKVKAKAIMDGVCKHVREIQSQVDKKQDKIAKLEAELHETRNLIPAWNAEVAEDLANSFDVDAPIHHQVYSMKDKRQFAGLGKAETVPPYLRAEGFVRHIFLSKAEMEAFMSGMLEKLFSEEYVGAQITTTVMHQELNAHIRRMHGEGVEGTEFAYAFICGLEAYRYDPDFELFDLMLSGAVHPSIVQDQTKLLKDLQDLVRECQERNVEQGQEPARSQMQPRRMAHGTPTIMSREQVNFRVMVAVLQAMFPQKTIPRQNALRRALSTTMQMLCDSGKTSSATMAYINDIFAELEDASQSPLVEEIRRQHLHEVIEFTAELMRELQVRSQKPHDIFSKPPYDIPGFTTPKALEEVLTTLDRKLPPERVQELVDLGLLEDEIHVPIPEAVQRIRQGTLLRPQLLWVKATTKEVVEVLVAVPEGAPHKDFPAPRNQTVKVLNNPLLKGTSYVTPEGLEAEIKPTALEAQEQEAAHQLPE